MSEKLKDRIKLHEGLRLLPYEDSLGKLTIGYGHLMTKAEEKLYSAGITQGMADELFDKDFAKAMAQALNISGSKTWAAMNNARRDVIIEMCFHLGMGGVLKFKRMWDALDKSNYNAAAAEMLDSLWAVQTPKRCATLSKIMLTGED
jgi:lysozyme